MATLLSDYISDTQLLLHDSTYQFYTQAELIRYCNTARSITAAETGCTRQLATAVTIYPQLAWVKSTAYNLNDRLSTSTYNGFYYYCSVAGTSGGTQPTWPTTNGGTVTDGGITWTAVQGYIYQYPLTNIVPNRTALGCLDVYVWYSGTQRLPTVYLPYSQFARQGSVVYNVPGMPFIWSQNNQILYISQPPSIGYIADFDIILDPAPLVNPTDVDSEVLSPYNGCVKYYMAHLAKLKDQRRKEAEDFSNDYYRQRGRTLANGIQRRLKGW